MCNDDVHVPTKFFAAVMNAIYKKQDSTVAAAADIHLLASLCAQQAQGYSRLYVSQPLLSDECPPICSTSSLALAACAQPVPYMAITS